MTAHASRWDELPILSAAWVEDVERENLALREALGLPAGSSAQPSHRTVPAQLPGIGGAGRGR